MRPKKHEATGEGDLFRARLDQIINLKHELVQLAGKIDWAWIDGEIAPLYGRGAAGYREPLVIGLLLLEHMLDYREGVCDAGSGVRTSSASRRDVLPAHLPARRSDLSRWRARLGGESTCCWPRACGGARQRSAAHPGPGADHRRHDGAAQEHHLPDRRQAVACGDQRAQSPRIAASRRTTRSPVTKPPQGRSLQRCASVARLSCILGGERSDVVPVPAPQHWRPVQAAPARRAGARPAGQARRRYAAAAHASNARRAVERGGVPVAKRADA